MHTVVFMLLGVGVLLGVPNAGESLPPYSQTYAILIRGTVAGTEKVTEQLDKDGNLVSDSEHEIFVTDGLETNRMAFNTSMVSTRTNLTPIRYSCTYTSGPGHDSYEVTVKDGAITRILNRGGRSSEASGSMRPGMVIVDFNVYHQYENLVKQYDSKKKGRQTFQDFIPIIGNEIPVALTQLDNSNLDFGKVSVPVRNFRIEFVGILSGILSIDKSGRLVRLQVPTQDLEVVRKDLLQE